MTHMYGDAVTCTPYPGCYFHCCYCVKSFQAQAKRSRCQLCRDYVPHGDHFFQRLLNIPKGELVFLEAYGDPYFIPLELVPSLMTTVEQHSDQTFLVQSKAPLAFKEWERARIRIPRNLILGITLESNQNWWFDHSYDAVKLVETRTHIEYNKDISSAPVPFFRGLSFPLVSYKRKYYTIEPELDLEVKATVDLIKPANPEFVYVGYDNHQSKLRDGVTRLPEPSLEKTMQLIEEFEKFTEVRRKTIRKAWWEEA